MALVGLIAMSNQTTKEQKDAVVEYLIGVATGPKYEGSRPMNDPDDDELMAFLEVALREIVGQVAENRSEASTYGAADLETGHKDALMDLFDEDNIEEIDVRDNGRFASPKVTVWLKDAPMWANDSWRSELKFSEYRNHYNGKPSHAVLDVRPF